LSDELNNIPKSALQQLLDQMTKPEDWLGAIVGGIGGSVVTFHMAGLDFGHSILVGAGAGVTGVRTGKMALQGYFLRRKVKLFNKMLQEEGQSELADDLQELKAQWDIGLLKSDKFELYIEEHCCPANRRGLSCK
jgi:hypothetical protein